MTCHWKEGAVFCLAGTNTWCFKNRNLWFGKVCFLFLLKTSHMEYLEAKQFWFFFFQKRPSWWAHSKNSTDFWEKKLKWDFAESGGGGERTDRGSPLVKPQPSCTLRHYCLLSHGGISDHWLAKPDAVMEFWWTKTNSPLSFVREGNEESEHGICCL